MQATDRGFETLLQSSFRLPGFRKGQKEIISNILDKKDVLAVLPTGGGKSLCFQFPAVHSQQLVVVISPLIALMNDQVASLKKNGIPAGCVHSGNSLAEQRAVFAQLQKPGPFVLYLSPERANKEGFQNWIKTREISLFAIDEAHCVSQWGHDFREEYGQLKLLKTLRPDVPVLALTASATPTVLSDISRQLQLKNPVRMVHGFYRSNLYYQVENCSDEATKIPLLLQALKQTPEGRCLIYCGTRKSTEEVAERLDEIYDGVGYYHAGLDSEVRQKTQERYASGDLRILVATNAFGMGIDRPDVRLVVHFQMPANIDALYQEMGRAGRDGKFSTCLTLYSAKDKGLQAYFIESSKASKEIKNLRWRNLDALVNYAEGGECRHAEILTYYKDSQRITACGHCDSCDPQSVHRIQRPTVIPATRVASAPKTKLRKARSTTVDIQLDSRQEDRFQILRLWRKEKATELDMPAFVIFSDKALRHLAVSSPKKMEDLRGVYGVGEAKLEKFGAELMAILSGSS
ncbi:ATP-dependent DNA helicase [bacterium]|nr:ATP-dependent DNA helicase [bacterium]